MTVILVLLIVVLLVVDILAWLSLSESGRHIKLLRNALALYGSHMDECGLNIPLPPGHTQEECDEVDKAVAKVVGFGPQPKKCNCGWEDVHVL